MSDMFDSDEFFDIDDINQHRKNMANNNYTGVVESVNRNDAGYWNIKTEDGQWFGFGKSKPVCKEGDEVAFDFSKNGKYNNADPDTVEVLSEGNAVAKKKTWGGNKSKSEGAGKEGYWENKEARDILVQKEIQYQAARNAAIAILDVALKNNVLEIPEGKKNNSKMEVLLTYVDKVTDRYVKATQAIHADTVKPSKASVKEVVEDTSDEDVEGEGF